MVMSEYSYKKNELVTGGQVLCFDSEIRMVSAVRGTLVVLLEDTIRNNVYGVKNGSVIWQVQDVREVLPSNSVTLSYSFMKVENDNVIIADDMGLYFQVDVMTGDLAFIDWKR